VDTGWYLESIGSDGSTSVRPVRALPFSVGRDPGNDLVVTTPGLSRHHASLSGDISGRLRLTDLGSTNGTFVNRQRIEGSRLLAEDDIIHFGTAEFRLRQGPAGLGRTVQPTGDERTVLVTPGAALSENFLPYERAFLDFLGGHGLSAAAQPIVEAAGGTLFAYELLGRCRHPELPRSPMHLFRMAATLKQEVPLSEAFRRHGVAMLAQRVPRAVLFVNTHPAETFDEAFLSDVQSLRSRHPHVELVLEVHETAVMETDRMRELAARWRELGLRFAYDDFGAGQARLNELGEVPAHFVKFDMALIRGIDTASERKQRLVRDLVRIVRDIGSVSLAEGVETEGEANVCRQMGFELIQGWLTGKPIDVDAL
jgi:EAL domain-containing protein (putative c-di-GMP-specific phosphodiesterase class I)